MPALLLSPTVWLAVACAVLALAVSHYRSELRVCEAEHAAFVSKTEALGEQAKAHKVEKESNDKLQIAAAITSRDAALAKLRDVQAKGNTRASVLPERPASAGSPDKICFQRTGLDAALQRFIATTAGISQEGDIAIIDNRAWLSSWPKPVEAVK